MTPITPGQDYKMQYLIKRRETSSREELVAHWFANHMPQVIAAMQHQADAGKPHATRYMATLFDALPDGTHPWDGVAQLWWPLLLPRPATAHGAEPTDSFQQRALPYTPWPTREYVVIDGSAHLPIEPLTLNAPFPTTRSGLCKITFLVKSQPDADHAALFDHWLTIHADNVRAVLQKTGGLRYVISHSIEPEHDLYAGMAELYFANVEGWRAYKALIQPDGMEQWVQDEGTLVLRTQTEMIGIA